MDRHALVFHPRGGAQLIRNFPAGTRGRNHHRAFPAYFIVVITLGLLATLALWVQRQTPRAKPALILQVLALAALVAIPLFVQPAMVQHAPGTPDWARWHGISMALNLLALIAAPFASMLALQGTRARR